MGKFQFVLWWASQSISGAGTFKTVEEGGGGGVNYVVGWFIRFQFWCPRMITYLLIRRVSLVFSKFSSGFGEKNFPPKKNVGRPNCPPLVAWSMRGLFLKCDIPRGFAPT